jgi:nitroreductase
MPRIVNDEALDLLFRSAHDCHDWRGEPVSDTILRALWELVALGPTSRPGEPGRRRLLFIKSEDSKARLVPAVAEPERAVIAAAPIAVILGATTGPDDPSAVLREAAMQAAYLIVAARALGLDCVPIWRFDAVLVEHALFPAGGFAASFLCALGHGEERSASRLVAPVGFDEACAIL